MKGISRREAEKKRILRTEKYAGGRYTVANRLRLVCASVSGPALGVSTASTDSSSSVLCATFVISDILYHSPVGSYAPSPTLPSLLPMIFPQPMCSITATLPALCSHTWCASPTVATGRFLMAGPCSLYVTSILDS
ncbi:hypothetical protein E2C01_028644 [Portunus trituberculatus]|uniref:Uncharacterized protein n=1 Tax=Portunus trituberculatus TaxID=210409 RepID=A0A5B7EPS0_PORTR|nr:hypothetical protein [Portunus trituberculatus]